MYPGTKFKLGDQEIIVPAISLGQIRRGLKAKIEEHDKLIESNGDLSSVMVVRGELILAAIRRNYTEEQLSDDAIWDSLDFENTLPLWRAILGMSGLDAQGEAQAAMADGMTSDGSIPPSPPLTGGPSTSLTN